MLVEVDLSVDDRTACLFHYITGSMIVEVDLSVDNRTMFISLHNGQYDRRGQSVCGRQNSLLIPLHKGQYDDRSRFPCARQIMQLADVHSRAGSVIVAADAVVPSDTVRSSAASLSVVLLDITGLIVTVAGQTGPVGAVVGGLTGELECQCTLSPVVLSVCLPFRLSLIHI